MKIVSIVKSFVCFLLELLNYGVFDKFFYKVSIKV